MAQRRELDCIWASVPEERGEDGFHFWSVMGWEIKGQSRKASGRDNFAHLKPSGISVATDRACQMKAVALEGDPGSHNTKAPHFLGENAKWKAKGAVPWEPLCVEPPSSHHQGCLTSQNSCYIPNNIPAPRKLTPPILGRISPQGCRTPGVPCLF